MRVLIVGGYGGFGGRLAKLLGDDPRLTIIIAGRSLAKAQAFAATLPRPAEAAAFDRQGDVAAGLAALKPDIVVDASGPWQAYGDRPYRLAEACIAAGAHYADLADDGRFVSGVARLDEAAKAAGVWVLTGASSFPVLTAAVVRSLSADLDALETVEGGIAPSPYAEVGLNVLRAIASYIGKGVPRRRDGGDGHGRAGVESRRYTVAPPCELPLHRRRFSLFDVPDLTVLPSIWPEVRTVWLGAAPAPELLHRALSLAGLGVAVGVPPSLRPFARLLHWATRTFRWGEHRGGMIVRVTGRRGGEPVERGWHMVAEGDAGPLIPSMTAEALIRAAVAGQPPRLGARPATGEVELADYERLFARHAIVAGVRETPPPDAPLYRRLLAGAWDRLPPASRALHQAASASGEAEVTRGRGRLAGLIATVFRFPRPGAAVPLRVVFERIGGREVWRRRFGGREMVSVQEAGSGRSEHLLVERFGPLAFAMALVVGAGGRMDLIVRRWTAFGLPLPVSWGPSSRAFEQEVDGCFRFDVQIGHPLTGTIVRYRGWLVPD